jgi:hypothetical protein
MSYNYTNQSIRATCLIEPKDNDSFYNPVSMSHTGFAWDGNYYKAGVQKPGVASWYAESTGAAYRGDSAAFPRAGLILLSRVSLTILDETTPALNMWMQFLLQSNVLSPSTTAGSFALTNNFNGEFNGWLPSGLVYTDGVISVIYTHDYGNETGVTTDGTSYNIDSNMVVNLDFCQDSVYLDVALASNATSVVYPSTARPVFTPAGGTYNTTQSVTISDTTSGAVIYYTLDGSTPTEASSVYSTPLTVSSVATIQAIAIAPQYSSSDISTATYSIVE